MSALSLRHLVTRQYKPVFSCVGGPVVVYKIDVAAKTTTENEIHKEKREIPVTLQNSSEAGMAPG